jgi:SAM-dependent methyltransferase
VVARRREPLYRRAPMTTPAAEEAPPTERPALVPAAPRAPFFPACPVCAGTARTPVVEFPELTFVRCGGCGVIYKHEQVPGLGHGYEGEYFLAGDGKYMRRWAHRVRKCRRQIVAAMEFTSGARTLLDVGCSAGYVLAAAKELGLEATGLDYSAFAVEMCRKRGFEAVTGSLTALPFPDASFDVVMLKAVLEHVPDPLAGLREAARVVRPGGVIFVIVPDGDYLKHTVNPRTCRDFRPDARGWQHHTYFHSRSLAEACTRAGLEVAYEGRAVRRRHPGAGLGFPLEGLRWLGLAALTAASRVTRLRRDIQAFVVRP